ncbi:hypothetical protein ACJJTC_015269 [Scirpophaga incertulas]
MIIETEVTNETRDKETQNQDEIVNAEETCEGITNNYVAQTVEVENRYGNGATEKAQSGETQNQDEIVNAEETCEGITNNYVAQTVEVENRYGNGATEKAQSGVNSDEETQMQDELFTDDRQENIREESVVEAMCDEGLEGQIIAKRYPVRRRTLPSKYNDYVVDFLAECALLTYEDALSSEEREKWLEAIEEEKSF